jgi:hypothetical protein
MPESQLRDLGASGKGSGFANLGFSERSGAYDLDDQALAAPGPLGSDLLINSMNHGNLQDLEKDHQLGKVGEMTRIENNFCI